MLRIQINFIKKTDKVQNQEKDKIHPFSIG